MTLLGEKDIKDRLKLTEQNENRLIISPLLEGDQIQAASVDLRLGTKFRVDIKTRQPFYDPVNEQRPVETFFQETYRGFGKRFILYPQQLVLASTFEYLKLPNDTLGILNSRSSWNRLGLSISTIVQPGYAGVLNLELVNSSSNPIALYPGLRLIQIAFCKLTNKAERAYLEKSVSKYVADAQPKVSNIANDQEISRLKKKFG